MAYRALRPAFALSHPLPLRTFSLATCARVHRRALCTLPRMSAGNGVVEYEEAVVQDERLSDVRAKLQIRDEQPQLSTQEQPEPLLEDPAPPGMGPLVNQFRVSDVTVQRLAKNGITRTTEVQAGTFDLVYDGSDIIAKSRTGTGKTLAFALPILERLAEHKRPRGAGPGCIVLAPTRELAKQVAREMTYLGDGLDLSVECFYGGSSYGPQENALRRGLDVVVGTPGRIMDHLDKGNLVLDDIRFAVLDEADEMLSMGFAQDVEEIFKGLPHKDERQVILFSATLPSWVKELASQFQKENVKLFDAITSGTMASTTVRHCAVRVPARDEARLSLLADIIAVHNTGSADGVSTGPSRTIVFTQTKREADELATSGALDGCGAAVLHGDVSQRQREVTLAQFRKGKFQVLVATDVAARGLDISGVDVVVQYRVPQDTEAYIHRSGRTGRAGKSGTAVVLYNDRETRSLKQLERDCKIRFDMEVAPAPEAALEAAVEVAMGNTTSVDERVIKHLLPRAEAIMEGGESNVETVAALLAIASRRTRLEDRSVLSGESGMRTLQVSANGDVTMSPGLVMRFIMKLARVQNMDTRVGLIRLCRDGSAVIDVPSDSVEGLLSGAEDLGPTAELVLSLASGVPQLRDERRRDDRRGGGGGGGRYDRRSGGGGGGGRYGRERGEYRGRGGQSRGGRGGYRSDYGGRDFRGGRDHRRGSGGRPSYRGDRGGGSGRRSTDFLNDDF